MGEKLFLKGDKCVTAKCPVSKKPYPPGKQGSKRRRGTPGGSEFSKQLKEKQKIQFGYGIKESQLSKYVTEASKLSGEKTAVKLLELLEMRLDNVAFRLGFADSRKSARQLVSHGHITVNGRKVKIASCQVKPGDKITIRTESAGNKYFKDIDLKLKKHNPPTWLTLDKVSKAASVAGRPELITSDIKGGINTLLEYYSR